MFLLKFFIIVRNIENSKTPEQNQDCGVIDDEEGKRKFCFRRHFPNGETLLRPLRL
jgi:hypothetical protein